MVEIVHSSLSINVLAQLACTSKQFASASAIAIDKKTQEDVGLELFEFIKMKPTYDERTRVICLMPVPILRAVLAHMSCMYFGRSTFTLNATEIPLSIEFAFQLPSLPRIFNVVFEETFDFAMGVEFDDFYAKSPTRVLNMAIAAFQAFAATLVVQFCEEVPCTVVSFDWVAHHVGLVKFDFAKMVLIRSRTVSLRRSELPEKTKPLSDLMIEHLEDGMYEALLTMFEFIPV